MKKIFNLIIIFISIFVLLELFFMKKIIYTSIMYALNIWVNNIIPSLFPFFIISDILINYNITYYIPKIIRRICKYIFNISDNMLTILILSMFSGFPMNARSTRSLYDEGLISINEANHILIFSHFANPAFILTTIAIYFFNNQKMGILLLVIHYLSNFILGFCFRFFFQHNNNYTGKQVIPINFGNVFINAIKNAIDTCVTICGVIVVFMLLSSIIINFFNLNGYTEMLIKGLFEITIGLEKLSNLGLNSNYKLIISSMILAFGGISVHVQVYSHLVGTKINYIYFFMGRMYQIVISFILSYILCLFFWY